MAKGKKKSEEEILREAIEWYGLEHQMRKLQEEAGELIAAINHFLTYRGKGVDSFHEEFVDVEVLMKQISLKLDNAKFNYYFNMKVLRLEERVKVAKADSRFKGALTLVLRDKKKAKKNKK